MAHIKKYSSGKDKIKITSTTAYSELWHLMFDNARKYNRDDSHPFRDANTLQAILDDTLQRMIVLHGVPGIQRE